MTWPPLVMACSPDHAIGRSGQESTAQRVAQTSRSHRPLPRLRPRPLPEGEVTRAGMAWPADLVMAWSPDHGIGSHSLLWQRSGDHRTTKRFRETTAQRRENAGTSSVASVANPLPRLRPRPLPEGEVTRACYGMVSCTLLWHGLLTMPSGAPLVVTGSRDHAIGRSGQESTAQRGAQTSRSHRPLPRLRPRPSPRRRGDGALWHGLPCYGMVS